MWIVSSLIFQWEMTKNWEFWILMKFLNLHYSWDDCCLRRTEKSKSYKLGLKTLFLSWPLTETRANVSCSLIRRRESCTSCNKDGELGSELYLRRSFCSSNFAICFQYIKRKETQQLDQWLDQTVYNGKQGAALSVSCRVIVVQHR